MYQVFIVIGTIQTYIKICVIYNVNILWAWHSNYDFCAYLITVFYAAFSTLKLIGINNCNINNCSFCWKETVMQ